MKRRLPVRLPLLLLAAGCDSLPERGSDEATVSIGQPAVYMRERSLIERFEDLEWLRLQRSPEKEKEYEQGFQGSATTATSEFTGLALKVAIGEALAEAAKTPAQPPPSGGQPEAPAPAQTATESASANGATAHSADDDTGDTGGGPKEEKPAADPFAALAQLDNKALGSAFEKLSVEKPSVSPRDKLANRIAFRDAAAEAIRQSSLDDVHDLEGMALYELQFDLSIVGGADPGQTYAVMLEVLDGCPEPLSESMATRVVEVLRAECLAEIEETTARLLSDRLTAGGSEHVLEANVRGELAARYADAVRVLKVMERVADRQCETARNLPEANNEHGDSSTRWDSESLLSNWRLGLERWDEARLDFNKVVDRIVSGGKLEVVQAQTLRLLDVSAANLRYLADLQRSLENRQDEVYDKLRIKKRGEEEAQQQREISRKAITEVQATERRKVWKQEDETHRSTLVAIDERLAEVETLQQQARAAQDDAREFAIASPVVTYSPRRPLSEQLVDSESLEDILARVDQTGILDLGSADALLYHLSHPDPNKTSIYASQALGFVIARSYNSDCGPLRYDPIFEDSGLDARSLLPTLLTGRVPERACWELPSTHDARVVSVTPTEVAEQITTSAYSDIRRAFSLALEGVFQGTVVSTNADFQRLSQELRRYELIGRNSLLVGFVGGDVGGSATNTFGWVMSPRLETSTAGKATLRYRHGASHYPVTATLIAPADQTQLTLRYRVFRIRDDGKWLETRSFPEGRGKPRAAPDSPNLPPAMPTDHLITLELPSTPEVIAQGLLAKERWTASLPKVFAARPYGTSSDAGAHGTLPGPLWRLQAKEKGAIVILGSNLWRNPQVYVGGQRATRVQILSDLGGLWAQFDDVQVPPGYDGKAVRADLVVSTSRGSDRLVNAVEILPPKSEPKEPEPRLTPPLQAVPAAVAVKDNKHVATFSVRFELLPLLPKAWDVLMLRARPRNAADWLYDATVGASNVFATDVPGTFELRDLAWNKDSPWGPSEILEVALQIVDRPKADPRYLHPSPVQVVLVRQPIACTTNDKLSGAKDAAEMLRLSVDTTVTLRPADDITATHLAALFGVSKEQKDARPITAKVMIGNEAPAQVKVAMRLGDDGFAWTLTFPKGLALGKNPGSPTTTVAIGPATLTAAIEIVAGKTKE